MRITNIRKNGKKLTDKQMAAVVHKLKTSIVRAYFNTEVKCINSTSIKVGMHMKCFTINTTKLGHNARVSTHSVAKCNLGYIRTNIPTWGQREQFNHIINNVLDSFNISASVKSGEYIIRDKQNGRVNTWDMPEPFVSPYGINVPSVLQVVPLECALTAVANVNNNAPYMYVDENYYTNKAFHTKLINSLH